jgi:hypothetical protein
MKNLIRFLVAVAFVLALPLSLRAAESASALTNADIVKMSKANLGDELIIAKVQQAQKVDFKLETDDIIALKSAGVHQPVISAMLARTTDSTASSGSSDDGDFPAVSLSGASGAHSLKALEGDHKQFAAPFVGLKHFMEFPGEASATRIKDRKPVLELRLGKNPAKTYWLVRLDPDDEDPTRGLDLESIGMWGGSMSSEPDEDFIISTTMTEAGGGVWKFTPKSDLKPGEYGLYAEKGFVYDFGVDK